MPLENISDTARWVAFYRVMESERPDAIFRDPYARRLAGPEGEAIVDAMPRGRSAAWAMIVRTAAFDEMILATLRREQVDLVVNLAAGLDTRPWRLALPPDLRWVDVDLPAMIAYKTAAMRDVRPVCRYEAVIADLTDPGARRALFARLGGEARHALVVTEGLLIYLPPSQVGALARDLHASSAMRWWLFDLANPQLLRWIERSWGKTLRAANSPFQFAPAEGTSFFRQFGWREVEYRSAPEEARRLHREMRMMWLWRLIGRLYSAKRRDELRRMSGFVLVERE